MQLIISLALLVLLVGGFRFCVSIYRGMRNTNVPSQDDPMWNPDHPHWKRNL